MNIIVCVKLIPDPEAPVRHYRISVSGDKMETVQGVSPVVNPFDENAIEAGLQLREAHGGKVTAHVAFRHSGREAGDGLLRVCLVRGQRQTKLLEGTLEIELAWSGLDRVEHFAAPGLEGGVLRVP